MPHSRLPNDSSHVQRRGPSKAPLPTIKSANYTSKPMFLQQIYSVRLKSFGESDLRVNLSVDHRFAATTPDKAKVFRRSASISVLGSGLLGPGTYYRWPKDWPPLIAKEGSPCGSSPLSIKRAAAGRRPRASTWPRAWPAWV